MASPEVFAIVGPNGSVDLTWYAVRSATRMEMKAERHLREQGFPAYAPCLTRWVRHARSTQPKRQPLFTGYLFVGIDHATQSCATVSGTEGVCNIVSVTATKPPYNAERP